MELRPDSILHRIEKRSPTLISLRMRDVQDVKLRSPLYSRVLLVSVSLVVAMALNLELNTERYIQLMEKLIGETEFLQNNPPRYVPQEDRYHSAEQHVMGLSPAQLERTAGSACANLL